MPSCRTRQVLRNSNRAPQQKSPPRRVPGGRKGGRPMLFDAVNVIVGNQISGNGADTADAATPGPTGINVFGVSPITGTIIAQNVFQQESYEVVVNTPAQVDVHLNNFLDTTVGVDNLGAGTSNAVVNWWACADGPGTSGCASVGGPGVLFAPWLTHPFPN